MNLAGAMWFGPRLGRKRRSDERLDLDQDESNVIADVINGAPWALVSLPGEKIGQEFNRFRKIESMVVENFFSTGGKRHALPIFTPRLGRELAEDYGYSSLTASQGGNQDDIEQRSPPFAPRLGRRLPFSPSPRLGRELRALFQKV